MKKRNLEKAVLVHIDFSTQESGEEGCQELERTLGQVMKSSLGYRLSSFSQIIDEL